MSNSQIVVSTLDKLNNDYPDHLIPSNDYRKGISSLNMVISNLSKALLPIYEESLKIDQQVTLKDKKTDLLIFFNNFLYSTIFAVCTMGTFMGVSKISSSEALILSSAMIVIITAVLFSNAHKRYIDKMKRFQELRYAQNIQDKNKLWAQFPLLIDDPRGLELHPRPCDDVSYCKALGRFDNQRYINYTSIIYLNRFGIKHLFENSSSFSEPSIIKMRPRIVDLLKFMVSNDCDLNVKYNMALHDELRKVLLSAKVAQDIIFLIQDYVVEFSELKG